MALRRAFSLVELLVAIAIMAVLGYTASMALSGLLGAGTINEATTQVSGILEQSRAYAMAHNTYVYIGFDELSSASTAPVPGVGRLVISATASTSGLAPDSTVSDISSAVQAINRPYVINNLHLGDLSSVTSGNMARPAPDTKIYDNASGQAASPSQFIFTWPLGGGTAQYTFNTVLQIDPQGVVSYVPAGGSQRIVPLLELGLQQTRGTTIPAPGTGAIGMAISAIQVQGINGKVMVYRP